MSRHFTITMDDRQPHRASSIRLPDGRRVSYAETGPPEGTAVLYCHGAIGTPLRHSVDLEAITSRLRIRHIAVNRPGIGGSDRMPSPRTVLDFARDVEALTEALEIDRFMVIGVSAGGPYALAAAHALGDRVARVAVCSSLSPLCAPHRTPGMPARIGLALSALAASPRACTALGDLLLPVIRRHPGLLHHVIAAHAAPSERERLSDPAERLAAGSSFLDATAYGVGGMVDDYITYSQDWGFRPAEVSAEVHIWHGANDPLVPVEHALQLAVELPRCRVFVDPEEGHHFFRRRLEEILETLLGRAGSFELCGGPVAAIAGER